NWITPCALGSGKFGTPWVRMHAEYFSSLWRLPPAMVKPPDWSPPDEVEGAPPPSAEPPPLPGVEDDRVVEVFELLTFATPGVEPPPPQRAIRTTATAAAATVAPTRGTRQRRSVTGWARRMAIAP